MSTTQFLREQVDASAEAWKAPHLEAMQCRELERMIAIGLEVFSMGRRKDDEWSRSVESGAITFDEEMAKQGIEFYRWWLPTDRFLKKIEDFEKKEYKVERADELRSAVRLAKGIASLSPERIARSFSQKSKGETVSLSEVLYGVQS